MVKVILAGVCNVCIFYTVSVNLFYNLQFFIAFGFILKYRKKVRVTDFERFSSSKNMIPISIIVPAYNEESTIVENIKSLLQLDYFKYEVIVVNDGSNDSTKARILSEFDLKKKEQSFYQSIPTEAVTGVYHGERFKSLVFVDKVNGGKADALNAGINLSRYPIFACIDADTILKNDSLIRLTMLFLENPDTVAVGGVVRIANGSQIKNGELIKPGLPKSKLAIFQIIEYFNAFLTGRISLSCMNSLLIISGAFGAFNKKCVIECGGYKKDTIGEDMELIVRLHKTMRVKKRKYRIQFLANPICFTQAPETVADLRKQRRRWQIGLIDSLTTHKSMLLNPKYGLAGMLSMPYFWLCEFLSPLIELFGYIIIPISYFTGSLNISHCIFFFFMTFLLGSTMSLGGILLDQLLFDNERNLKEILIYILFAVLQNFGYRQLTFLFRLEGTLRFKKFKNSWGNIKRKKFAAGFADKIQAE